MEHFKSIALYLLFLLFPLMPMTAAAQEVTDAQYEAAVAAIVPEATYRIFTLYDGWEEGTERYYLTDGGRLTDNVNLAGSFVFHKISGDGLYMPVSWQVDQCFTNPDCWNERSEWMVNHGYIRTNTRGDAAWESQVWYKDGDTYAVRATNATALGSWGCEAFWCVAGDTDADELPNADYTLTPQFVWRLERVADPPTPVDPSEKEVARLSNIPHVYINTFNNRFITSKDNYVYARMWYVDEDDNVTFYDSLQIRGRGNATWGLAKKPYKLKFNKKAKLLGKGYANAKKWTMLANHGDKTLIRNAVTSLMGEFTGLKYNPAAKFVDLTLNDRFDGNYQISDQVEVRPHRVNITEQDVPLTEDSDITGGYLFENDNSGDFHYSDYWDSQEQRTLVADGFDSPYYGLPVRIHYPEPEDLDYSQLNYARQFINDFEYRLYSEDFQDPVEGYRVMVDSASLANWYICTEISGNVDGLYSTYFYKEQQDDHIFWGPLWDYDISYNNDNRDRNGMGNNTLRQLMVDVGYGSMTKWVRRFWEDPWFGRLINRRFHELVDSGIEDYLNAKIDSLTALINESQQLNYQRWSINSRALRERVLYSTYDEYVRDLRNYIHDHLIYLDDAFAKLAPEEPEPGPDPGPGPEPGPKEPDFPADTLLYYAISNKGTGTFFDVSTADDLIVCNARDEESESQQWRVYPLSNGYLYVVNRATGYALNDPTEGNPTATTLTGAQLNTVPGDSLDIRQQWDFVARDGYYNLVSRFSQHVANLRGGSASDGTSVLSYTSDDRDAVSNNRLWAITDVAPVIPTSIDHFDSTIDFALAYDPQSGRLHFGADNLSALTFAVSVYDHAGRLVRSFRASAGTTLAGLPRGLYLVTWTIDGRRRTVKFLK